MLMAVTSNRNILVTFTRTHIVVQWKVYSLIQGRFHLHAITQDPVVSKRRSDLQILCPRSTLRITCGKSCLATIHLITAVSSRWSIMILSKSAAWGRIRGGSSWSADTAIARRSHQVVITWRLIANYLWSPSFQVRILLHMSVSRYKIVIGSIMMYWRPL